MSGLAERLPGVQRASGGRSASIARLSVRDIRAWPIARQFLLALVALFLVKQAINVVLFPPFTGHDEVAHYTYIRYVAELHRVPVIIDLQEFRDQIANRDTPTGDFFPTDLYKHCRYVLDWNYCDEARWQNAPPKIVTLRGEYYPHGWIYTANHPPLYYIMMAPIYWVSQGASPETQQYLLRAAAIPFGLAVVLLAYAMTRMLFPTDTFLAITVPAFVALQPQVSYEAAMVNNDIAGIAVFSLILYLLVRGLRRKFDYRLCVIIGFSLGIGLLFKGTTMTVIPTVAIGIIAGCGLRNVREWVLRGGLVAAIAGAIAWPWYLFLYRTYGNFSALDQVAELQYSWTYFGRAKPSILDQLFDADFALLRWRETWGEFGWRLIQLDGTFLFLTGLPCLVAVAGLLQCLGGIAINWRLGKRPDAPDGSAGAFDHAQVSAILMLFVTALIAYGAVLQFGTRFSLTQSRYFFPAINAISLLLMLGFRTMLPERWRRYGQATIFVGLVLINVLIYTQYVIPYWYLGT